MSEPSESSLAPATVTEAAGLRYLDAVQVHFTRQGAQITLTVDGAAPVEKVSLLRAFPLSEADRYVSVRNEKNEEIGLLADPARLDAASRAIMDEEMHRRYVVPVVRRLLWIRERFEIVECKVETDRGTCQFSARNLRESVLHPHPGRYILTDVDGNRYDIPDIKALPLASQVQLLSHL